MVENGISDEFQVNIDLRQRSALSLLLLSMVMELFNMNISKKDVPKRRMYTDNLTVIAESKNNYKKRWRS